MSSISSFQPIHPPLQHGLGVRSLFCTYDDDIDMCYTISANPAISGIGVRLIIYAHTFTLMVLMLLLPDPAYRGVLREASRSTCMLSTALIIGAWVEWWLERLSLFDGLMVTMLTTILTAFIAANGPYIRTLGYSSSLSNSVSSVAWCYWGLQVWVNPKTFGLPLGFGCTANEKTSMVLFGHAVGATSRGLRIFAIIIFAAGGISAVYSIWVTYIWVELYFTKGPRTAKNNAAKGYMRELRLARDANSTFRGQHEITWAAGMMCVIYMIVTLEQTIARAPSALRKVLNTWSPGQWLSVLFFSVALLDLVCIFLVVVKVKYKKRRPLIPVGAGDDATMTDHASLSLWGPWFPI